MNGVYCRPSSTWLRVHSGKDLERVLSVKAPGIVVSAPLISEDTPLLVMWESWGRVYTGMYSRGTVPSSFIKITAAEFAKLYRGDGA